MQINLLKDIVVSIIGSNGPKVVDLLYGQKNVSEFLIAKKLSLTINQTRNLLYRLADEGLVSFIRKKDPKKGGWYTYFWTLNSGKSLAKFRGHINKLVDEAKSNLGIRSSARFYFCPTCSKEYDEENSLLNSYTCPECGEPLQLKDNSALVLKLKEDIKRLELVLAELDIELHSIAEVEQKTRHRKMKVEVLSPKKSGVLGFIRTRSITFKLILVISIVSIFSLIFQNLLPKIFEYFALNSGNIFDRYYIWTLFTHLFLHADLVHLLVNMFSLYFIGSTVEFIIGKKRYISFFFISGIFAGIVF